MSLNLIFRVKKIIFYFLFVWLVKSGTAMCWYNNYDYENKTVDEVGNLKHII
jgi:hypothetical protein